MIRLVAAMDSRRGVATDSGNPVETSQSTAAFHEKTAPGLIVRGWATYNEFAAPLHERENDVSSRRMPHRWAAAFEASAAWINWSGGIQTRTCG